jgi:hypothetical protein
VLSCFPLPAPSQHHHRPLRQTCCRRSMPRRWFRFRPTVARGLAGLSVMGRDSVSPTRSCRFVRQENGYAKAPPKAATAPSPTRDDFRGARSASALRATADRSRDPLAPSGPRGMPHHEPQVKPAGRLDVAQQCLGARQRVAVLRSGNPAAPRGHSKTLPEKRKSSRVADDGEVSPSLIIINGVHAKAARSTMGGDSADDACEIDLDERSLAFRRPRPAAGTMAPRGGPTAAGICPGADTGSGQRLRMGWPVFQ